MLDYDNLNFLHYDLIYPSVTEQIILKATKVLMYKMEDIKNLTHAQQKFAYKQGVSTGTKLWLNFVENMVRNFFAKFGTYKYSTFFHTVLQSVQCYC